jgi:hypothetical protein
MRQKSELVRKTSSLKLVSIKLHTSWCLCSGDVLFEYST